MEHLDAPPAGERCRDGVGVERPAAPGAERRQGAAGVGHPDAPADVERCRAVPTMEPCPG
ncbi:MAG: hypothetical protein LJF06_16285 [Gemmatimonadetes bacterium]|nr:hypothetical protein [Gemmatimonadota bacterium]